MRHLMSLNSRRELLTSTAARYQKAAKKEKQPILDQFTASTGYHRKYATRLLKNHNEHAKKDPQPNRKARARIYNEEVRAALIVAWEAANRICSKRLVPFLPEMVAVLEKFGHLSLAEEIRARLLGISPRTVDRLLYSIRHSRRPGGLGTTRPGALIKGQIPIRTFSDWDDDRPGFMEADLVAHCGTFTGGHFLQTLVMTDISTGWTEFEALLFRDQETVLHAICCVRQQIPFDLLGLDTDNGTEFLNYLLLGYCFDEEITFTRSRPYKKNDQCHVEEKNGSIIRKFIGYDRFEGIQPCRTLSALYKLLRLYVNFFQPSLKLASKTRVGSRVIKKYDPAKTPYQRVQAAESVTDEMKQALREQYEDLDPVRLLAGIETLQDQLWPYAYLAFGMPEPEEAANGAQPKMSRHPKPDPAPPNPAEAHSSSTPKDRVERMYRRTKKPRRDGQGKRWWRTRPDPFAEVWAEVEQRLSEAPFASGKGFFLDLQRRYPGKFPDGQLRTFQRRVRDWRVAQVHAQIEAENDANEVPAIPGDGDLG